MDKTALNEALYHGGGVYSDFIIAPFSEWGPAVEGATTGLA